MVLSMTKKSFVEPPFCRKSNRQLRPFGLCARKYSQNASVNVAVVEPKSTIP